MPLFFNGTEVKKVFYNGTEVKKINYNGTEISFGKIQPRWVGEMIVYDYQGDQFARLYPLSEDPTFLTATALFTSNPPQCSIDAWRFNVETQKFERKHSYYPGTLFVIKSPGFPEEGLRFTFPGDSNKMQCLNIYFDTIPCDGTYGEAPTGEIVFAEDGSMSGTCRHESGTSSYVEIVASGDRFTVDMSGFMSSGDLHLEW